MKTATQYREPETIRKEIRELLTDIKSFIKAEEKETPEHAKFEALKKELSEAETAKKENEMFLFVEAQNLVNKHLNKVIPQATELIKNIFGDKFLNMDNSRNHKYKNYFDDLEQVQEKQTKKYKYRLTTSTRTSYSNFIIDVSILIWNDAGSQKYSDYKYLAQFENQTSFKSLYDFEEFKTYTVKQEFKKLQKYEEQKKKLDTLKSGLNNSFMNKFSFSYNRDKF
tara:strand:+ start:374 stop:1048 length:675 start_codon:yes stop_codon:yes gene_type:complete